MNRNQSCGAGQGRFLLYDFRPHPGQLGMLSVTQNDLDGVVGIVGVTSRSFVTEVLGHYARRIPFVILKSLAAADAVPGGRVRSVIEPDRDTGWIDFTPQHFHADDAPAQVVFTSGTEGRPKAIVLSHRALTDVVTRLNEAMRLDGGVREYVGVPASYSFGLGRFRACAAVGGRAYIPANGFNPVEIAEMLRAGEINAVSAVPTLWRTVLENRELFDGARDALRWIEIGSQYMSGGEKAALRSLFPRARIVQHYGLTEASRSTFLVISEAPEDELESVGRPTGNVELRLSPEGCVQIRGPHVASGVLTEHGLQPLTDEDGWLTTKDEGELRNGNLHYLGRADDLINCGGIKLTPDVVEQQLLARLGIEGGLGVGRFAHPARGDGIVIAVEPGAGVAPDRVRAEADRLLAESGLRAGNALVVRETGSIPRTETGKVKRRELAALAEQAGARPVADPPKAGGARSSEGGDLEQRLIRVWSSVLKSDAISTTTNFYDSGGDSLTAIAMMLALEKHGIGRDVATRIFDGETIEQIARGGAPGPASASLTGRLTERITGDAINIVRGVLVLCLIAIHFLPGVWERLPVDAERMEVVLHPFYRFGTPGFALVFGLGVGFFYFHQMAKGGRVWRRIRFSAIVILTGILLLGMTRYALFTLVHDDPPKPLFSSVFYSVLVYYLLAVLSIPLWFRLIYRAGSPILRTAVASGVSLAIYTVLDDLIGPKPLGFGPAELVRLMLEANYNYFRMTGIVLIGAAIGLHYRTQTDGPAAARLYLTVGSLLMLASILIPLDMGHIHQWLTMNGAEMFAVTGYTGIVMVMLGLVTVLRMRTSRTGPLGVAMRILAACGILSLPSYVAHGLVIPVKSILAATTGLSETVALGLSLGTFFLVAALAVRKVYRLYG